MNKLILWFLDRIRPNRLRCYVHTENKYLYLLLTSEKCNEKIFRQTFPEGKAKEITVWKFDRLHFRDKIEIVLFGEDQDINEIQEHYGTTDEIDEEHLLESDEEL